MPIRERDPWRFQFFEYVDCPDDVRVPTDDIDCYDWFPAQRWIYEKLNIARSQGLACGMAGQWPESLPVFAKPNVNLRGMGLDSGVVRNEAEFAVLPATHMWMPLLHGEHISTDCAVEQGEVRWMRHALGFPWVDGMFTHWMIETTQRTELNQFLMAWVRQHLGGYTGMLNMESIGGTMIEAHLRFADQWVDIYGRQWLASMVGLYAEGLWRVPSEPAREGYSVPLFARHGIVPPHPTADQQARIRAMPGVSSLQITYFPGKAEEAHPMPPGGFRLGIINCWDLQEGLAARRALAGCFPDVEVLLP